MSKDKPEVGDVFKSKSLGLCKILLTNERVSYCLIKEPDGGYSLMRVFNTYLTRLCKLLGNSSITLDDLFKTEEEE